MVVLNTNTHVQKFGIILTCKEDMPQGHLSRPTCFRLFSHLYELLAGQHVLGEALPYIDLLLGALFEEFLPTNILSVL